MLSFNLHSTTFPIPSELSFSFSRLSGCQYILIGVFQTGICYPWKCHARKPTASTSSFTLQKTNGRPKPTTSQVTTSQGLLMGVIVSRWETLGSGKGLTGPAWLGMGPTNIYTWKHLSQHAKSNPLITHISLTWKGTLKSWKPYVPDPSSKERSPLWRDFNSPLTTI